MPDYNVILAGRYGVGKSSLFYRLREGQPPEGAREGCSTRDTRTWGEDEGVDCFVYKREREGRKVKVSLWDTGGQERHDSMTANYFRNAHAVVFVYSVEDEGTLFALNDWVREAKVMNRQPEQLVLALWGSKSDLDCSGNTHAVKQEAVDAFTSTYQIPPHLNCRVSVFGSSAAIAMDELLEHIDTHFNGVQSTSQSEGLETLTPNQLVPTDPDEKNWKCCSRS